MAVRAVGVPLRCVRSSPCYASASDGCSMQPGAATTGRKP